MLVTEGGQIESSETATSLYGSFSPWLVFDCFSASVIFGPFSAVVQKDHNASSAGSVKLVNNNKVS